MSDHTQSIPRVGGDGSGQQGAQSSGGFAPRTSTPGTATPGTTAIPTNGARSAARTGAPTTPRTTGTRAASGVNQPWSPTQSAPAVPSGMTPNPLSGPPSSRSTAEKKARAAQKATRGPRKARLQLRHIDTWSALKISLVLSIVMFFVWMVAVGILYGVLSGLNVFDEINKLWGQLGSADGSSSDLVTPGLVFGGAALIGAINIVLFTALATISTYIYNLSADLVGGLEVTLTERE